MTGGIETAGDIVTGGIFAAAVEGSSASAHAEHPERCLDCGTPLIGPHCHQCGQAGHLHSSITGFGHEILHGVFHFEGKVWRTLPMLALHPGHLTRRYVDGQRMRFVSPTALFLFSVFLMFAVVSNIAHWGEGGATRATTNAAAMGIGKAGAQVGKDLAAKQAEIDTLEHARAAAVKAGTPTDAIDDRLEDARQEAKGLATARAALSGETGGRTISVNGRPVAGPGYVPPKPGDQEDPRNWSWIGEKFQHIRQNPELFAYKLKSYAYKYSWALIPISLPFLWLMFCWRRRFGLYDHAVFATYSLSFMSLLVVALVLLNTLGGVVAGLAWLAFMIVPPIHMYKQLRYGYELSRFSAAWRLLVLLNVVVLSLTLFGMLILWLGGE